MTSEGLLLKKKQHEKQTEMRADLHIPSALHGAIRSDAFGKSIPLRKEKEIQSRLKTVVCRTRMAHTFKDTAKNENGVGGVIHSADPVAAHTRSAPASKSTYLPLYSEPKKGKEKRPVVCFECRTTSAPYISSMSEQACKLPSVLFSDGRERGKVLQS